MSAGISVYLYRCILQADAIMVSEIALGLTFILFFSSHKEQNPWRDKGILYIKGS